MLMNIYLTLFSPLLLITITQNTWAQQASIKNCGLDDQSIQLAKLIIESPGQHRQQMFCNKELSRIANVKARLMAKADRISHNIDNITPNELLQNEGVVLPYVYQNLGNQVEAVLGGMETAQETLDYFMRSPDHKAHLLGENNFFHEQNQIGVGYYLDESTKYEEHWVVYITAIKSVDDKFDTNFKLETLVVSKPINKFLYTPTINPVDRKFGSRIKSRVNR